MIGRRIQILRQEHGMSISELAEKAQVAKSYLSNIERGIQKNPSIQTLEKVAEALRVTVDDILHVPTQSGKAQLDSQWIELVREAMQSGVTKEQFREYLEFTKWRNNQK